MCTAENGSTQYHCFGCQEKFAPRVAKLHLNLLPVSKCLCELEMSTLCFFLALTWGRAWKFMSRTKYPVPVMQTVQVKAIQKSCCCNLVCHWRVCSSWSLVVSAVVSTASTLAHLSASITARYHAAPASVLVYNQEKEWSFCPSGEWRRGRRARWKHGPFYLAGSLTSSIFWVLLTLFRHSTDGEGEKTCILLKSRSMKAFDIAACHEGKCNTRSTIT